MATHSSKPLPYTANPLLLVLNDLVLFVQITFTWPITAGLPSIVLPLATRSGALDELGFSAANLWTLFLHIILIVAQLVFVLSLIPLSLIGLPLFYFLYIVAFVYGNQWASGLLNGPRKKEMFESHPDCVKGKAEHPKEKWVFINGVAVGNHWLQANLDLLAMTFRRPIFGIHNQTRGIIFDVLECIIQRDLGFATTDIRAAYAALIDILADKDVDKVVLVVHSQGAIEGGLVLDWLYDTVAAEQLRKLEVYTFGNAANHWNAPVISNGHDQKSSTNSSSARGKNPTNQRIVQHIEHYANEGDYVSKFGILHFRPNQTRTQTSVPGGNVPSNFLPDSSSAKFPNVKAATYPQPPSKLKTALTRSQTWTTSPQTPIERDGFQEAKENNRFFGLLFKRASSGHLLNMHYLDYMFEMEGVDPKDRSKGEVKSGNEFMDAELDQQVFKEWDTVQAVGDKYPPPPSLEKRNGVIGTQIKHKSRLWEYKNGDSPSG